MKALSNIKIMRNPADLTQAVKFMEQLSNQERDSLGFIPNTAFPLDIENGNVFFAYLNDELAGYLLVSINYPRKTVKIIQTCIHPKYRNKGIGHELVNAIVDYAQAEGISNIRLKCAVDLEHSNKFWQSLGFRLLKRAMGRGKSTRTINYYGMPLSQASLLNIKEDSYQIHVVLDTCAFLNMVKENRRDSFIDEIIDKSVEGYIRVSKTPQLENELSHHAKGLTSTDPAAQKLDSVAPIVIEKTVDVLKLEDKVFKLIFPLSSSQNKKRANAEGDARHLAYAICGGASHFVTYDKHLLLHSKVLAEKFNIQVVQPYEALDEISEYSPAAYEPVVLEKYELRITELNEMHSKEATALLNRQGLGTPNKFFLKTDLPRNISALGAFYNNSLIALLSTTYRPKDKAVYIQLACVDNTYQNSGILEYLVYMQMLYAIRKKFKVLSFRLAEGQEWIISLLNNFGFQELKRIELKEKAEQGSSFQLRKHFYYQSITDASLDKANIWLRKYGNLSFRPEDWHQDNKRYEIISKVAPAPILLSDSYALIVPIQPFWAKQMFSFLGEQRELYTKKSEPFYRTENVYYRSPRSASKFKRGIPVLFYVSSSPKAIVAHGIITKSIVGKKKDLFARFKNIGVYSEKDLKNVDTNLNGEIHAFTFSWLRIFQRQVDIKKIKQAVGSNISMVTAYPVGADIYKKLLEESGEIYTI